ncbi:MAG: AI-2E family transporter, partial [Alphaproteobacteria bacterium]|nr:AI-2E family transporter [Alphaproteobacteria bacterium]
MSTPSTDDEPGPGEFRDPLVRDEIKRAGVWIAMVSAALLVWWLAQPLLLIGAAIVLASMLDGGTRLIGRVLPIARGWRLLMTIGIVVVLLAGFVWLATTQLADQAATLRDVIVAQTRAGMQFARHHGMRINPGQTAELGRQLLDSAGRLTSAVGSAVSVVTQLFLITVLGLFLAAEPRLYERGLSWLLPSAYRASFHITMLAMGHTLRRLMAGRLLGMLIEGCGSWLLLGISGVPMAALLGAITGILAFLPNIGAIVSGVTMVLVGFSGGLHTGFAAIGVWIAIHVIDGYIIVPMVAKRAVELPPAL